MSAETDFRALLAGHAGTAALVGTRVAMDAVPEGSDVPLVVFTTTHTPDLGLNGTLHGDLVAFSVQCWGASSAAVQALATQVKAAVATNAEYALLSEAGAFDAELNLHAVELGFDRWLT